MQVWNFVVLPNLKNAKCTIDPAALDAAQKAYVPIFQVAAVALGLDCALIVIECASDCGGFPPPSGIPRVHPRRRRVGVAAPRVE